ncbi:MAG: bifunctional DNA primase/polymerase [Candidatus Eisenbacteria bacterium]|nr:bifunctional DNA primase/polymerase [Candidatus Eisenbacteria bacterium]
MAHLRRTEPRAIHHGWDDLHMVGQTDRRDAIRIYARLGLHPIIVHGLRADGECTCGRPACAARGKHPVLRAWQTMPLDVAALDAMLISEWRYSVGLRMGAQPSGMHLVCLDVDGPRDLLTPLEAEHGALPPTLTARTGRGGQHLIYQIDPALAPRNRVRLAPGVDVRAEGGMIVAAPSRHASGNRYEWLAVRQPEVLR